MYVLSTILLCNPACLRFKMHFYDFILLYDIYVVLLHHKYTNTAGVNQHESTLETSVKPPAVFTRHGSNISYAEDGGVIKFINRLQLQADS